MELPPFPEKRPRGKIKGIKFNKKEREGEIIFKHKERKFYVIRGEKTYGKYDTMVEAYYIKKTLMEHNWDESYIIQTKTKTEKIYINQKIKKATPKINIKFCPKCGNKIKSNEIICPICGINLYEVLNIDNIVEK